ncbi:unnamed protein product [Lactuca saligna]|uniref:RING-type E3 ubiquitin transferase n=1 Tax=Lactuca saligna TaxID=75948 RepID=A0AA35YBB1_LACSI|nr:unnamed protein product [Lactuca saligna]
MADRSQNMFRRVQASASMASAGGGQDEAENPMVNRSDNRLPRFAQSAPQQQMFQPSRAPHRVCPSCTVEEDENVIPLESDSNLGSGGTLMEDVDDDVWIDYDLGQHQNHHSDSGYSSSSPVSSPIRDPTREIPVVFTDPDVLDCPICLEPFRSPIYQCQNGHIACSCCCTKSNHKCPSCCLPIGFNRCRAMEKLVNSITVDCENKEYGCTEPLIYHMKAQHEQVCSHTLCFCPLSSCRFTGSYVNLYVHFRTHHSSSATSFIFNTTFNIDVRIGQKYVILQEQNERVIFILNHDIQGHGRVFNVDCVGPNVFRTAFAYKLSVRCSETCFSIKSVPEVSGKWEQHTPNKNYLIIPSEILRFTIELRIKKSFLVW